MTQPIPETPPDYDRTRIVERPDGFYWQDKEGGREYGPFPTLMEAVQDMEAGGGGGEDEIEPEETLEEAEKEIGISEFIDPETGGPAEDGVPRLEDH
jgi:hypothetical protein